MNDFLINVIHWLYSWTGNYGWAMVVFTVFIRLVLLPFDFKSRVSMRKMSKLQPKVAELQKKYGKDPQKLNQKTSELYKKERVSPFSGCVPMLLSYPIIIIMWGAMREFANQQMVVQVFTILQHPDQLPQMDNWFWVKNLWMPDSPFSSMLVDLNSLRQIGGEVWEKVWKQLTPEALAALPAELQALTADNFSGNALAETVALINTSLQNTTVYQNYAGVMPGWQNASILGLISVELKQNWNGLFLLPILSAVSQVIMTKLTPSQPSTPAANDEQAKASASTGKFMQWFFPLFSLWICASYNGAFALYWVTSNLVMMASTIIINKYLDAKEKKSTITGEGIIQ